MTLQDFQREARYRGNFRDNSDNAMAAWWKGWGLGSWWEDRWCFKEYKIGNITYKSGKVHMRHGSYTITLCYIGDEQVSEYKLKKFLLTFDYPKPTPEEQAYIDKQRSETEELLRRCREREVKRAAREDREPRQLVLDFDAVA